MTYPNSGFNKNSNEICVIFISGVTAWELCHYFFGPEYRMEWETTVEEATVLEKIAPDTLIFLQLHKRVWPAAQRDALFWSHMRHIPRGSDKSTTDPTIADTMFDMLSDAGKTPVMVEKDVPGFIGNRLQHALWRGLCGPYRG